MTSPFSLGPNSKVYPVPRTSSGRHEDIYWTSIGFTYVRTDPKSVLWTSYGYPMDSDILWISNKQSTGHGGVDQKYYSTKMTRKTANEALLGNMLTTKIH